MFAEQVLNELIKNGHSKEHGKRVWNIANHKLLYSTPQLAQGFLDLSRFPRYKANNIDREIALVRSHVPSFFGGSSDSFNLVDLGCGDGSKAEVFIKSLPHAIRTRYYSIDVSLPLAHLAKMRLQQFRSNRFSIGGSLLADFSSPDRALRRLRKQNDDRTIYLLLGGTLASFEINDFLFSLSRAMRRGDIVVIGNGIRTGKRFVGVEKYKHPVFNEWFIRLMHALGFASEDVAYDARFSHGRLEFFYRIKRDKIFVCNGKRVKFQKGDEIIVAVNYKYFAHELETFAKMYFSDVRVFPDKDNEYALILGVK